MTVDSPAGKFILSFERMDPGDGEIIITGKMGVWDAKTHMTLTEFVGVLRMTMTPRMIGFLTKSLIRGRLKPRKADKA